MFYRPTTTSFECFGTTNLNDFSILYQIVHLLVVTVLKMM